VKDEGGVFCFCKVRLSGNYRPVIAFYDSKGIIYPYEPSLQAAEVPQKEVTMVDITYKQVGDYMLPDIILKEPQNKSEKPLEIHAILRQRYLSVHRPILYSKLLLTEKLYPHLREIDEAVKNRLSVIADKTQANENINELIYE
jgi:hypothetical protein